MTDSVDLLTSIKYQDEEEIKSFVEGMAYKFRNCKDQLLESLRGESMFTFTKGDQEKALKAVFLSLALANIGSNLYNPFLKKELIKKFQNVSDVLGIPYPDLVRLSADEDKLRKIVLGLHPLDG